ncbi:MAG: hypothetical protein V4580_18140 [Bacteroidota bacterium]
MGNLKKYNSEKATICSNNNCVTVYGDTARFINIIIGVAVLIAVGVAIAKALK